MSNRRAARPWVWWVIGAAAVVLALVIIWALLVPGADWLARHDVGSAGGSLAAARDAARGRLLTLGAGLIAVGALVFTARNFALSRRTFELTEQGQVTNRFTMAIEQLGSDKLDVRIGGIYALERVARDPAKDHPTVMAVLTAFIREHSHEPWPLSDAGQPVPELTRPDVQAAVTVVGRRDAKRDILVIDLAGARLTRADLGAADLGDALLVGADLTGANLGRATLTRANLADARLGGADLARADLGGAVLASTDLTEVNLTRATLTHADLTHADLTAATLTHADLAHAIVTRANLGRANLTRVRLADARLRGARFAYALLVGADLTEALLAEADLTRADLTEANLTGANLAAADLSRADLTHADFTRANLVGAHLSAAVVADADLTGARWSADAPVPEGWMRDGESGHLEQAAGYQR